jgi:hypothetical protein
MHRGGRHTAAMNAEGDVLLPGQTPQATVSEAMELVTGSPSRGWEFWHVQRDGELVPLARLRAALRELPGDTSRAAATGAWRSCPAGQRLRPGRAVRFVIRVKNCSVRQQSRGPACAISRWSGATPGLHDARTASHVLGHPRSRASRSAR